MTKQEKIREEMTSIMASCEEPDGVDAIRASRLIVEYLHSCGVAIKVERELPTQRWDEFIEHDWIDLGSTEIGAIKGLLKTGYSAWEPLI